MKYEFYLLFLRTKSRLNIIAWLIRKLCGTNFDHVEIVVMANEHANGKRFGACYGIENGRVRKTTYPLIYKKYDLVEMNKITVGVDQYKAIGILKSIVGFSLPLTVRIIQFFDLLTAVLTSSKNEKLKQNLIETDFIMLFLTESSVVLPVPYYEIAFDNLQKTGK